MQGKTSRRSFLKTTATAAAGLGLARLNGTLLGAAETIKGAPNAERLGWRLGIQTYTFHEFSLFDAIDKTASLGLRYLETFEGQLLGEDYPTARFQAKMPADMRTAVKKKLADSGITLLSHYEVGPFPEMLAFCKDMGMELLITDVPDGQYGYHFDTVDKYCEESGVGVALTNHPHPVPYWNPEGVLKACRGCSKRIGASGDLGHWVREGLNPLECVKKLEERLVQFHFRDMNHTGMDGHDVPLGTGMCDIPAILSRVHDKGIQPIFMLECPYSNSMSDLAQGIAFFNEVAGRLAASG